MIFLHITDSHEDIERFKKYVAEGKDIFVLIFKVGCPPCEMTIPKWKLIENKLTNTYKNNDNIVVADINMEMLEFIEMVVGTVDGFPTMKYIGSNGKVIEAYEESRISKKDRSVESFVSWIESKIDKQEKKHIPTPRYNKTKNHIATPRNYKSKPHKQNGGKTRRKNKKKSTKRRK